MAQARQQITLPCPARLVWETVTGEDQLSWRTDLKELEREEDGWVETARDGSRYRLERAEWEPGRRCSLRVTGRGTFGVRTLTLEEGEGGTTVTLYGESLGATMLADLLERSYLRRSQRDYLQALRRYLCPAEGGES